MKNKSVFLQLFICLSFLVASISSSKSQNLIPNHSFEITTACPQVSEITVAPPWNSPTDATPDLFKASCPTQNISARTGITSAGVVCFSFITDYREFIQAPLNQPLTAGQTYCVSFYVKRRNTRYSVNRFGAYLSIGPISQNNNLPIPINSLPQVEHDSNNSIVSTSSWTEISGSFTAVGGESHIIIGNFYDDFSTYTQLIDYSNTYDGAYYQIDDVSLTPCSITNIADLDNLDSYLTIFPIPANDVIHIKMNENLDKFNLLITDLYGREIRHIQSQNLNSEIHSIVFDDLKEGIYFISLHSSVGTISKKMIINR